MTKEKNIATLNEHLEHWKRLLSEKICDQSEGEKTIDALQNAIKALEQEQCEDCISRQAVLDLCERFDGCVPYSALSNYDMLPPVTSQPEVGRWIYDKNIDNWKCSECGETPKTMGYCGSADFMTRHFKYCNHCGAKMQEVEDA